MRQEHDGTDRQILDEGAEAVTRFCSPGPPPKLRRRDEALLDRAETFAVEVSGDEVRVYAWGTGPTILLVHGWASCAAHLAAFVDPLVNRGHRVVAADMPAHGRSTGALSSFYAFEQTLWRLRAIVGPPAGVVAHSGGAVVTTMAASNGLEVPGAVFVAPMVRLSSGAAAFAAATGLDAEQTRAFTAGMQRRFGRDVWERTATDLLIEGLNLPALLIHDRDDPEVSYDEVRRLAALWPGAQLVTTVGLGHQRILRHAEAVERAVAFLT